MQDEELPRRARHPPPSAMAEHDSLRENEGVHIDRNAPVVEGVQDRHHEDVQHLALPETSLTGPQPVPHPAASAEHDADVAPRRADDDHQVEESLVPVLSCRQSKQRRRREREKVYTVFFSIVLHFTSLAVQTWMLHVLWRRKLGLRS